ncbi:MAG TPA: helix-turn-helix domain-containing protein [Pseudonocardiaceae bacterium]|jgi:excisionase family DNA binding protein|nr:helix-turn-helix domain-containing protein [Pseudonocardiaceae bacterium]
MSVAALKQETYLPREEERVAEVYDFLKAHDEAGRARLAPRYFLSGAEAGDRVELPPELYRVLRQVAEALRGGLAVTVVPQTTMLTTQQAAELLGVSRPTVIKLLESAKIPYERVGNHRKILLRDLLEYRERRRAEQYAALEATAVSLDDEDDVQTVLQNLREARQVVARRRRTTGDG